MRKCRKLKVKISQALYHNSGLQKSAVELKKSLDEVSNIICNKAKVKKK